MSKEIFFLIICLSPPLSLCKVVRQMSRKAHQIVKTSLKISLFRTDKCDILMETVFVEFCVPVSNYSVKMQCEFFMFQIFNGIINELLVQSQKTKV